MIPKYGRAHIYVTFVKTHDACLLWQIQLRCSLQGRQRPCTGSKATLRMCVRFFFLIGTNTTELNVLCGRILKKAAVGRKTTPIGCHPSALECILPGPFSSNCLWRPGSASAPSGWSSSPRPRPPYTTGSCECGALKCRSGAHA